MVLSLKCREDVSTPLHLGWSFLQNLDEHQGHDNYVRTCDALLRLGGTSERVQTEESEFRVVNGAIG